jgi:hypothetical protein
MELEKSCKTSVSSFLFLMLFVVCRLWISILHSSLFGQHLALIDWFCVPFRCYAFGGTQMCNIRKSFCGKEAKFQVMHFF